MKRALLIRTDAIGDLILTLPVMRSIREAESDTQVVALVSRYTAPLLAGEKYLDQIATIPASGLGTPPEIRGLARDLKSFGFDTSVLFYPRLSLALACWLAKIPLRIGTARRAYSLLFSHKVALHRRDSGKHELELNYELVREAYPDLVFHEPSLTVLHKEREHADQLLQGAGIAQDDRYVIVHPLSHGSAPNWRLENYVRLVERLEKNGVKVVVTGAKADAEVLNKAFAALDGRYFDLAGATDLSNLKAIIARARILVSGSTGPIHIASAVGTFGVGIYPPDSALSAKRWGPRGANKLFVPEVDSNKRSDSAVMDLVDVDSVARFIIERLESDN